MKRLVSLVGRVGVFLVCAGVARAADQIWNDASLDNTWSTNAPNWDAGAAWANGNSAVFSGSGEMIDISGAVSVSNITFQSNGYTVADANTDGTLTVTGMSTVISVANAGSTGTVSEVIAGSGGFTKAGNGVLNVTATNTFTGPLRVSSGLLRLNRGALYALGAVGAGNETIIESGATLDFNGAYTNNFATTEHFQIAGAGIDGLGALVNTGAGFMNGGFGTLTLLGNATLGCVSRIDIRNPVAGSGYTLTKSGGSELAVGNAVTNCAVVINAGKYTYMNNLALGTSDFDTTLNGGDLRSYGTYTLTERLIGNSGSLIGAGGAGSLFNIAGRVTLNGTIVATAENGTSLELSGLLEGTGGITRSSVSGSGNVYVTGNTNTYSGPTTINSGCMMWVGKTNVTSGVLGTGVVTNNGTLYAYSPKLGSGEVVNVGTLCCNAPTLESGRIVNKGTLYGTSILQVANGIVNSGTFHCFSGALGSGVVTNYGTLTVYTNFLNVGQFVNHGTLNILQPLTLSSPVTFNGGTVAVSSNALLITGPVTVNTNATCTSTAAGAVEISGAISGTGGFTQAGDGGLYLTSDANTFSGPTLINSGKTLYVGKTLGATGLLGSGVITNWGTLYANSGQLCNGSVVNFGTLYCNTGSLVSGGSIYNSGTVYWKGGLLGGTGAFTNNNNLYIDCGGAFTVSNGFFGYGNTYLRYGGQMTVSGSVSSNANFRMGNGTLTLTNGADFCVYNEFIVANRLNMYYPVDPSNVVASLNVMSGTTFTAKYIVIGDGTNVAGGVVSMTGTVNQAGGVVQTFGRTDENNGIRLGHYPSGYGTYNMMGGTLTIGNDYELCIATDGAGWFNMTGGEVYATRIMLNERDNTGGFGKLTVSGGVMNLGSRSGLVGAVTNGIAADLTAPYLVEFGGSGGVIRAVTNIYSSLNMTLFGTNESAITFDSTSFTVNLSGKLTGKGGLNKTGVGVLTLSGTNTYSGATRIMEGALTPVAGYALSTNSVLAFGVSADGSSGRLSVSGDLSLSGLSVGVANPELLNESLSYVIATYGGSLTSVFGAAALPSPWYVFYDVGSRNVRLQAARGTLIRVR